MEEMYDIPGYEGRYKITKSQKIWSVLTNRFRKQSVDNAGYLRLRLTNADGVMTAEGIHRLMMLTFVGPPPADKPFVNHKDGNRLNNDLSNLEYVSHSENVNHSYYKLGNLVKPVRCIETNIIYPSVTAAARALNLKGTGHISDVCNGKRSVASGYHWEYADGYKSES